MKVKVFGEVFAEEFSNSHEISTVVAFGKQSILRSSFRFR